MPPEHQSIDLDPSPPESVVEFGAETAPRRRRWNASGLGHSLVGDRRLVPLTAALAAVALLASLVSEWQVTTVDAAVFGGDGDFGDHAVPTDLNDLGAFGTAFLVGLFPLVAAVVLTMFGPPAARRWVRLTGLSVGGTLLALHFALTVSIGEQSRVVPNLYTISLEPDQVDIAYGRGLWCALAGLVLAMIALYLTDRHGPADAWTWRRPPAVPESTAHEEPLDLTVGPAKPFTLLGGDRDKPS
ncbi:hypothetical protein [Paractinoplanes durhamensis]|uniref:Uncharacterized protein n=1 Tax=Paractinoplanes durhamensis TaxID=113563 RepID=A0ABQ3Z785_9ACTN|nr:hypothetical protein [Actinoplanes durhamensis]GIE05399.1 hypothetical protein Adu01nite_67490 [Actinoplanes durhamensis]